ncbi:MAG: hypothetical protein HYY43_03335 [Deltaproteobacteria bacterium]|nr:hypothetical protein [Deltaproteobacteria bacterium]
MNKTFFFVMFMLILFGCSGAAKKEAVEIKQPAAEPVKAVSSEKYQKIFNEAAEAMYGFQWVKDEQNLGKVDAELGELYVPQALRAKFGMAPDNIIATPELTAAIANVNQAIEDQRVKAVKKTLSAQNEVHFWFDLARLSESYQKAARYLVEASYWMHELYKLQLDADIAATASKIYAKGDVNSIRLFERNAGAFCGRYGDAEKCSVLQDFTEPKIGAIMWPDDMDEKAFEEIKSKTADPNKDPLLSPFTVVKKSNDGTLTAIPYAKFEPFRNYLEKIAALMEQAAGVDGIDPSFANQLKLQAEAFRSDDPRPYFNSDDAWGKAAGELDLTIGPYETYEDPYGTKAFFEFGLGVEDKEATDVIKKFLPLLPHIEQMFSLAVGPEVYQAKNITNIPPLRVVRIIAASGEMRKAGGPAIAFSLPNIGPMADEGMTKRVIMSNHHEAKYKILSALAEIAIVPEQLGDIDAQSFVFDSTFHEIMHGIGPKREAKVGDSNVFLSLGEYYDALEEAKANVGGVWAAKFLVDNGVITAEQLKKIYTTYVAGLLRIMRFGAKEAHARGAAFEFSYLYSHGGIEERGDKFAVNYEKLPDALNSIVAEIGHAQAKGDKAAAKALLEDYPAKAPALLETLAKKFASSSGWDGGGIPRDVALVYHVKGM